MSNYLKKLVSLPVKKLAEYLLDRFLGKFVGKIDLNREGTSFKNETLTLPDLNLNCCVSQSALLCSVSLINYSIRATFLNYFSILLSYECLGTKRELERLTTKVHQVPHWCSTFESS